MARGQHVSIAYEILTDGRRWLGYPTRVVAGGDSIGGLPAAGRDHIYICVCVMYICVTDISCKRLSFWNARRTPLCLRPTG